MPYTELMYQSNSIEETNAIGEKICSFLQKFDLVSFFGDLGSGKTTLIKAIISSLCPLIDKDAITSPTFTYLQIHKASTPIFHFDLYRLPAIEDFLFSGFHEYFSEGLSFIEWPDRILSLLPKTMLRIDIERQNIDQRLIRIQRRS